mmetsp:Transcript_53466/g.60683  ORF Transcript_53466/g.60683 Transcript_53466/m.60683 type:complete len:106 (-) Transcript_53466:200-517(-)
MHHSFSGRKSAFFQAVKQDTNEEDQKKRLFYEWCYLIMMSHYHLIFQMVIVIKRVLHFYRCTEEVDSRTCTDSSFPYSNTSNYVFVRYHIIQLFTLLTINNLNIN